MNSELNCKIINFYTKYKKNHGFKVDYSFVSLIHNYTKNHKELIEITIDLHKKRLLLIAKEIAELRLQNYILLKNYFSIKDIKTQIEILNYLYVEYEKKYTKCNSIENYYIKDITRILEIEKKECYICYDSTVLYNFYDCSHYICSDCHFKIKNKNCPCCNNLCQKKSQYIFANSKLQL